MSIRETLFVVGVHFKNTFILRNFYELIPLTYYSNCNFSKNDKIPYFGIEGSFVSVIPKLTSKGIVEPPIRGIRKASVDGKVSASFGNSVAINFQILEKNFHIKVSSSKKGDCKFHITGVTRWSQVDPLVTGFINHIKCVESIWVPFFQCSYEQRLALVKEIYDIVVSGQQLRFFEDPYVVEWIDSLTGEKEKFKLCIKLIVRYVVEDGTPDNFCKRLMTFCSLQTGNSSIFHHDASYNLIKYDIYNGSYSGTIGYNDLYFIYIVRKLAEQGYQVGFSNLGRDEIRVKIEIHKDSDNSHGGKTKDKKEHLFVIKSGGSVTLSSKALPDEALAMGKYVIDAIRNIIESKEYTFEKTGTYYDNVDLAKFYNNNIEPLTQDHHGSLIDQMGNLNLVNSLLDEYENEDCI